MGKHHPLLKFSEIEAIAKYAQERLDQGSPTPWADSLVFAVKNFPDMADISADRCCRFHEYYYRDRSDLTRWWKEEVDFISRERIDVDGLNKWREENGFPPRTKGAARKKREWLAANGLITRKKVPIEVHLSVLEEVASHYPSMKRAWSAYCRQMRDMDFIPYRQEWFTKKAKEKGYYRQIPSKTSGTIRSDALARLLGVQPKQIKNWAASGVIKGERQERWLYFLRSDVRKLLDREPYRAKVISRELIDWLKLTPREVEALYIASKLGTDGVYYELEETGDLFSSQNQMMRELGVGRRTMAAMLQSGKVIRKQVFSPFSKYPVSMLRENGHRQAA